MRIDDRKITCGDAKERQLRNRVAQLTRYDRACECYIGVTSNYRERAKKHRRFFPHFERMVVLFKTREIEIAQEIEQDLIYCTDLKNANILPGGEGLKRGKPWYYVYVLIEPVQQEAGGFWGWALTAAGLALGLAVLDSRRPSQPTVLPESSESGSW